MRILLILLAVGFCQSLQPNLQYTYHYRARVANGIPDISEDKGSASDVRADLKVFALDTHEIIVKVEHLEFANTEKEVVCDLSDLDVELPIEYLGHVGTTFVIGENGRSRFNKFLEPGMVNFYKSIAQMFTVTPVYDSFFSSDGPSLEHKDSAYIAKDEVTLMGTCDTMYTHHPLDGVAAAEHEQFVHDHVEQDCQLKPQTPVVAKGRKTTGRKVPTKTSPSAPQQACPTLNSTLHTLTYSIDLGDCSDRVEHQHTLNSIYCSLGDDQCKNLYSRNTHGVYYLRGGLNDLRIEKAELKGSILVSPYGYETEHLVSVTKQKIALVSVLPLAELPPLNDLNTAQEEPTFKMILPYKSVPVLQQYAEEHKWIQFGTMKETVQAITNIAMTPVLYEHVMDSMVQKFFEGVRQLKSWNFEAGGVKLFNEITVLMYEFTTPMIKNVVAKVQAEFTQPEILGLFYDIIAEVGTNAAVEVLLEEMQANRISCFRQAIMFGGFNNNLKSGESLRPILNYIKTTPLQDSPFRMSQSLVNFASIVQRFCGAAHTDYDNLNSFQSIAAVSCQADGIVQELENFLVYGLKATDKFWMQMVYVRSLVNLKTTGTLNALKPYILGEIHCDPTVRAMAIDALANWNQPTQKYKTESTLMLLDIFENPGESRVIRSRALGYLASWQLSSTAWSRLALSTHRSGLKDLAALTYSLIKSTSEMEHPQAVKQRQFAQHALTMSKPSVNAKRHSSFKTWFKYCFGDQISQLNHLEIIKDPSSVLPAELALFMRRNLGGAVFHKKMEMMISNDNGNLFDIASSLIDSVVKESLQATSGRWNNYIRMLQTDLNIEEKARELIRGLVSFIPVSGREFFIPFETEFLQDVLASTVGDWHQMEISGIKTLYMNPLDFTFTTVNDMGLPVVTNFAMPTAVYWRGHLKGSSPGDREFKIEHSGDNDIHYRRTLTTDVVVSLPWSHSRIGTGVSTERSVNFPLSYSIHMRLPEEHVSDHPFFKVVYKPSTVDYSSLWVTKVVPYAMSIDADPHGCLTPCVAVIREGNADDPPKFSEIFAPPGALAKITHRGDVEMPWARASFTQLLSGEEGCLEKLLISPSARLNFFEVSTTAFPSGVKVDDVTLVIKKEHLEQTAYSNECGGSEHGPLQTTGQQTSDYDDIPSQVSKGGQSFGAFGEAPDEIETFQPYTESAAVTPRVSHELGNFYQPELLPFMNKLRKHSGWLHAINGYSIRFSIHDAAVELLHATTSCYQTTEQKKNIKTVTAFGVMKAESLTYCIENDILVPLFNDLDTVDALTKKNLTATTHMEIMADERCLRSVGSLDEVAIVTPEALAKVMAELTKKKNCGGDVTDAQLVQEFHDRTYYNNVVENFHHLHEKHMDDIPIAQFVFKKWKELVTDYMNIALPHSCPSGEKDLVHYKIWSNRVDDRKYNIVTNLETGWAWDKLTSRIEISEAFDQYSRVNTLSDYEPADYCTIDEGHVHTFDGLVTNITMGGCPMLLSTPCETNQQDAFAVAIKKDRDGGVAVHLAAAYKQLVINIDSSGEVDINSDPVEAANLLTTKYYEHSTLGRHVACHVHTKDGVTKVELPGTLVVIWRQGLVQLKVEDRYRGYLCGLCGNMDWEAGNDMVCPRNCALTDSDQFGKAWTPATGFDCQLEFESKHDCLKVDQHPTTFYSHHNFE